MNDTARIRSVELGEYIVKNKSTVRAAAKVFGVSKSTVHTDVTQKLEEIDPVYAVRSGKYLILTRHSDISEAELPQGKNTRAAK